MCWDVNNLYRQAMSQKLLMDNFEWVKDTSSFNKDFIKDYNEDNIRTHNKIHQFNTSLL